ncbi:MAG: N-acetyltransferase [Planctomycetota bacterium]|nr:MAG: N-acetyltransferase [Planctomycetota bacterium]
MEHGAPDSPALVVLLRDVTESDLPVFYEHQLDPEAARMAAFPARDREAFMAHWKKKVLGDHAVVKQTILFDDQVAGHIVCFEQSGRRLVGYWLGRHFWRQGIATRALSTLLVQAKARPLDAYVARHNVGSIRVLEKCGFRCSGGDDAEAGIGADGVEEFRMTLE